MAEIVDVFKTAIVVMAFYSMAITLLTYAMPVGALSFVTGFSTSDSFSLESISGLTEGAIADQTNIPVIEIGALVFYSGNILIDLLLNFVTALPQMVTMLLNGLLLLINVETDIVYVVEIFATTVLFSLYIIGLIQLLTGIRSGRVV